MDAKKFGAFISEQRKALGLTQEQLAKKIGVTNKAVSRWETASGFPDISSLEPLAEALDLSIVELMKSERLTGDSLSAAAADEAIAGAVGIAEAGRKKTALKALAIFAIAVTAVVLTVFLGSELRKSFLPEISLTFTPPVIIDGDPSRGIFLSDSGAYLSSPEMICDSVFGPAKAPSLAYQALMSWGQGICKEGAGLSGTGPYLILPYADVKDGRTRLFTVGYYTEGGKSKPIFNSMEIDYEASKITNPPEEMFERVGDHAPDALKEFRKSVGE